MKKTILTFLLLIVVTASIAQGKGYIQGIILDKEANNEPLAFANITIENSQTSLSTDIYGMYNAQLDSGAYTLVIGFAGYQKIEVSNIVVKSDEVTNLATISMKKLQLKSIAANTPNKKGNYTLDN